MLGVPGGTSSDPESPFYQSLLARWLTNDPYRRLSARDAILADAVTTVSYSPDVSFLRGDCDGDGNACSGVGDALELLSWLFLGNAELSCRAACDPNGDGELELADAVYGLNFCFKGTDAPLAPFPVCGPGTKADAALGCETSTCE